ncbi:SMP-30/gluconolactonase/LRE family protein [Maribacter polysaccharolyticus]|uniref:SMP-30/gluconolactonase/LRE family protein n=1 Tax=Maribacter polysaccharolyticus TaxID=3020831 RepID=UPI00237F0B9E|nr:SMP-30/gluconolactonase/LRE family protein [Maribacter polysaccharolyticus]MDE3741904.1 SMP-30/gluconolactonase/LRE family protein [Maribacter polysaccharolyticus]
MFNGLLFLVGTCFYATSQENSIIPENAEPVLIASAYEFTEGPAADKEGNVYFTDQPNDQIVKWSASDNTLEIFLKPSGRSNGLYFDNDGNLIACADEKNELWLIDKQKNITILVDGFDNKKMNGPNDLWIDSKGGIYLTDPFYKRPWWEHEEPEQAASRVYYLTPDKKNLRIVADGFVRPNGIIGSPDGKTLYIADIGDDKTYSYSITENNALTNKKLFAAMGSDGMTLDSKGNVYLTGDGVTVFNNRGEQIHHIPIDRKWTANVTFGGKEHNKLFITAMNSVYILDMNVTGAH